MALRKQSATSEADALRHQNRLLHAENLALQKKLDAMTIAWRYERDRRNPQIEPEQPIHKEKDLALSNANVIIYDGERNSEVFRCAQCGLSAFAQSMKPETRHLCTRCAKLNQKQGEQ